MFLLNSYLFVAGGAAVNPVIRAASYTDQSGGNPDLVSPEVEYTDLGGADSLTVYGCTGTNPVTVSKAQLKAGSGGANTLEFFSYAYNAGTDSDVITGLTATSNAANRIAFYVEEDNNGGTSDIETVTVSGLDFTAPAAPTAATNTAGNAITLTFAEAVYGTQDAADFVVSGAGVTTVSAVTGFGTSTLVLTLAGTGVARGDTVTLAYTETDSEIRDANGNALANFSGLAVTNNAGVSAIVINSIGPQDTDVPVAYDIDIDDSTVEAVLFLSTDPNPTAADFNTGSTSGYIDLGQVALTTAGSGINLVLPAGLDGTYKLGLLPTGGGDANVAVSGATAIVTESSGNQTVVVKSADEARNSTTTFANDSELVSDTLEANSTYLIKAHLRWAAGAAPDIKFTLDRTGLSDALIYWQEATGVDDPSGNANTWGTPVTGSGVGFSVVRHAAAFGTIRTGTNTGTVAVQWAQNASNADNTTVFAGSHLIIEKAA